MDAPLISKEEGNIKYLDYLSYEELVKRHSVRRRTDKIVPLDFVLSGDSIFTEVKESFDYVIACHVIEHVPDFVGWLRDIQKVLNHNGILFLAVPDKRYTFDILRHETSLAHILNDHLRAMKAPDFQHVFKHFFLKRDVSSAEVWRGQHKQKLLCSKPTVQYAYQLASRLLAQEPYVDVHCHVFTSNSFKPILQSLIELQLIDFYLTSLVDVVEPYNEFLVFLRKSA